VQGAQGLAPEIQLGTPNKTLHLTAFSQIFIT